jgi:hypothetical protein
MDPETERTVASAMQAARLRALRTAVLPLHKAILDAERARYEQSRGKFSNAHHALRVVMEDPFFAWFRPLATFVVQADERLSEARPLDRTEVDAYATQLRALLQSDESAGDFHHHYRRTLQDVPDVVVLHGKVIALLQQ